MADEQQDDDILELDTPIEDGDEQPEQQDDDDLSLEIEGEETEEDTPTIRQLRQRLRDSERELYETRKSSMAPQQIEIGKKPDLWEDCEGDADKFEEALSAWHTRKTEAEAAQRRAEEQARSRNQQFERAAGKYQASAAAMKIKGFSEAEAAVRDTLGPDFLGAIIQYADDPAKLVGALGNNPAALVKVSSESDPMRQFKMLIDMEKKIVAKRNTPPPPETDTIQRGTASVSRAAVDKKAEKLLEAATRSGGSMDEYRAYMKSKK